MSSTQEHIQNLRALQNEQGAGSKLFGAEAHNFVCGHLEELAELVNTQRVWVSVDERLPTHNYTVIGRVTGGPLHNGEDYTELVSYIEAAGGWKQGGIVGADGEVDDIAIVVSKWMDVPR